MAVQFAESPSTISLWSTQPLLNQKVEEAVPTFLKAGTGENKENAGVPEISKQQEKREEVFSENKVSTAKPLQGKVIVETSKPKTKPVSFYELASLSVRSVHEIYLSYLCV